MRVVFEGTYSELKLLNNPSKVLKDLGFFKSNKVKLLNNNNIIIVLFNWQINIFFCITSNHFWSKGDYLSGLSLERQFTLIQGFV